MLSQISYQLDDLCMWYLLSTPYCIIADTENFQKTRSDVVYSMSIERFSYNKNVFLRFQKLQP